MSKEKKIALVGNPNIGKSSLFNAITGLNQKVSNFPGTTVDIKTATLSLNGGKKARLIDLPGTYSLHPKSPDEEVTFEVLVHADHDYTPDLLLFVADAANLKRNLLLFSQVVDLGIPTILVLNMVDIAAREGISHDLEQLKHFLGVPVVATNARKQEGITGLLQLIASDVPSRTESFQQFTDQQKSVVDEVSKVLNVQPAYRAWLGLHHYYLSSYNESEQKNITGVIEKHHFSSSREQQHEIAIRYQLIDAILKQTTRKTTRDLKVSAGQKLDQILTHKVWGFLIFMSIILLIFQAIFAWAEYPMQWIEGGFAALGTSIGEMLPSGMMNDLIANGIIPGIAGVMVFLPQILILFFFIALLEDFGYMARVSFMMDRLMRPFGLSGRSVVPLISGMACAVPAIMSARGIENWKQRLVTIMVTPLMSCSARLPVYTLLIAFIIPEDSYWGPFNLRGLLLLLMYFVGFGASLLSALIFKWLIRSPEPSYFVMEMPGFKWPLWKNIGIRLWSQAKTFTLEVGKVILAISIVLWLLASFAPGDRFAQIEKKYEQLALTIDTDQEQLQLDKQSERLTASYAGIIGQTIEPLIRPLGFNWKIGIALVTSFAAREVFVGTMATLYGVEGEESSLAAIRKQMKQEVNPHTGKPQYAPAVVMSLMFFYAFALQCMSTIAVVKRETKGWKWPFIQLTYMTILAYGSSFLIYQLLS